MNKLTDEQLFELFQNGDNKAFDQIVLRYKDKLYTFLYMIVGDYDLAQDLAQDTYLRIFKNKDSYNKMSAKFSTWMYTIAKNGAFTELRKKKRRKTYAVSEVRKKGNDGEDYEFQIPDLSEGDLESKMMTEYKRKSIQSALSQLKQDFRTIIILRDIQELSYDHISRIVEVPIGTVKSRINRAREKLLELLKGKDLI